MSLPPSDLTLMPAHALSHAIHSKQVSCREVMAATLERISGKSTPTRALLRPRQAPIRG